MKIFVASLGYCETLGLGTTAEAALCDFMWKYYTSDIVWRVAGSSGNKVVIKYSYLWDEEDEEYWSTDTIYFEEREIY